MDVHTHDIIVPHTMIDFGVAINLMTKETVLKLNFQGALRKTNTMLQLADRYIVASEEEAEDLMVSTDSWKYPTKLFVLQAKPRSMVILSSWEGCG